MKKKYIVEDFYKSRPPRIYEDCAPCIRADRQGLKVVEESDYEKKGDEFKQLEECENATSFKISSRDKS